MAPKIFTNSRSAQPPPASPQLLKAISTLLPSAYNFEILKTIQFFSRHSVATAALQMPEGLLMYATTIVDILLEFSDSLRDCVILADVTYGACCVDPDSAIALGAQAMVHYGHSCLIPTDVQGGGIPTLYVFVEIQIDVLHLVESLRKNFSPQPIALVATVQFVAVLQTVKKMLEEGAGPSQKLIESGDAVNADENLQPPQNWSCLIPRTHPLSPGEILGCTSPAIPESSPIKLLIYVGDGRFHLESMLISNPTLDAIRYDPYSKKLTSEKYDHDAMRRMRSNAVQDARISLENVIGSISPTATEDSIKSSNHYKDLMKNNCCSNTPTISTPDCTGAESACCQNSDAGSSACFNAPQKSINVKLEDEVLEVAREHLPKTTTDQWGVVVGTLGKQGSLKVLESIKRLLQDKIAPIPILLSELSPAKLALFPQLAVFVQTSCPRLSIDWGYAFEKPLLTPYECAVTVGSSKGWQSGEAYPMDFYADDSREDWTPRHGMGVRPKRQIRKAQEIKR